MGKILKLGVTLAIFCVVSAGLLAYVFLLTTPLIEANAKAAFEGSLREVLPGANVFKNVSPPEARNQMYEGYAGEKAVGLAVKAAPRGYAGEIEMLVGIDPELRIKGMKILNQRDDAGSWDQYAEAEVYCPVHWQGDKGPLRTQKGYRRHHRSDDLHPRRLRRREDRSSGIGEVQKGEAMNLWKDFNQGIVKENPVLRLMIGLCPVLAVSNNAINALGMSIAVAFVLIGSNLVVALIRKATPDEIRIPIFIIIISTFVTICDYVMQAYTPELYQALGVFVPLIVVNCIILGRAEAFAYKNPVLNSVLDGAGMSLGFLLALVSIGVIREVLGAGSVFGITLFDERIAATIMILPPGAFITIGCIMAFLNKMEKKIL